MQNTGQCGFSSVLGHMSNNNSKSKQDMRQMYFNFKKGCSKRVLCSRIYAFYIFKIILIFSKVFIEFITVLFPFYVLVFLLQGMWDLWPLTRDQTHTPCIGRQSLNHWKVEVLTTREVPSIYSF